MGRWGGERAETWLENLAESHCHSANPWPDFPRACQI
ncbi:hypothetical protein CCACVL1_15973 [Corchorus capsularis]|uniref:Uncharacterized protein n=1 Tax=Corchorus capsularis TaxID=210143 RepID=A0A1R3I061_COCAP|nr:hypothetical protein CCACVL1_15973 [Corchorus capsularis]